MIKLRTIVILVIIYLVSYVSITYNINLLYPYYLIKDIIIYPVKALTSNTDLTISNTFHNSIITSLQQEVDELKKISNIKTVLSDFDYVNATIIERNREYWFNTITIDKGKMDGLDTDMAVVDQDGLVGRISSVRDTTSDIKLITTSDVTNKISVLIKNKDKLVYGIINGYDSKMNLLKVYINEKMDIYDNSSVETTGMGGVFPKGILIGTVFDTMNDANEVSLIVRVRPSSNIEGERYVSILKRKEMDN